MHTSCHGYVTHLQKAGKVRMRIRGCREREFNQGSHRRGAGLGLGVASASPYTMLPHTPQAHSAILPALFEEHSVTPSAVPFLRRPDVAAGGSVELRPVIADRHGCGSRRVQPRLRWHIAEVPRLPGVHDAVGDSVELLRRDPHGWTCTCVHAMPCWN